MLQLRARYDLPFDIAVGGYILRGSLPGFRVDMTWESEDEAVLRDHGQLLGRLGQAQSTDSSGAVQIGYQVRQERQNRRLIETSETASLTARVEQFDLVNAAFELPGPLIDAITAGHLISGTRSANGGTFPIKWHTDDVLDVVIENNYRYRYRISEIAFLHRQGIERFTGRLFLYPTDGTYRGTLDAVISSHADGTAILGLGGIAECHDDVLGTQQLYVVGEKKGATNLWLHFYPATPPDDSSLCQPVISYPGRTDKYRRPSGSYLPLNDTRWSTPSQGYTIEIPAQPGTVTYSDQSAMAPELEVCSEIWVLVTKIDPNAEPTITPVPNEGGLCKGAGP